jgi:hypothetical protein
MPIYICFSSSLEMLARAGVLDPTAQLSPD